MVVVRVHRAARGYRNSRSRRLSTLEQLNVRLGIHICDYVVEILEIAEANFRKRGRKLLKGCRQKLERVPENPVLAPLDLKILFHVLADKINLAFRSLFELVNDQIRIVATEVVEKHWDF